MLSMSFVLSFSVLTTTVFGAAVAACNGDFVAYCGFRSSYLQDDALQRIYDRGYGTADNKRPAHMSADQCGSRWAITDGGQCIQCRTAAAVDATNAGNFWDTIKEGMCMDSTPCSKAAGDQAAVITDMTTKYTTWNSRATKWHDQLYWDGTISCGGFEQAGVTLVARQPLPAEYKRSGTPAATYKAAKTTLARQPTVPKRILDELMRRGILDRNGALVRAGATHSDAEFVGVAIARNVISDKKKLTYRACFILSGLSLYAIYSFVSYCQAKFTRSDEVSVEFTSALLETENP